MTSMVGVQTAERSPARAAGTARHATPPRRFTPRRWDWLAMVALVAITVFGAVLRAHGFSGLGLYRDDAWVALSSRVGIGTAWHMWATAPGIFFVQRIFTDVTPGTTTWQQVPAFVAGVACIPVMYALARSFKLGRLVALAAAFVVSLSPICVTYSTRVKEYQADFLLACLVLVAAEAVRRRPQRWTVTGLAAASVVTFLCSASLTPVIVGSWVAVLVVAPRDPPHRWLPPLRLLVAAAATAAGGALVALAFYLHPSPAVKAFWGANFIQLGSLHTFADTLGTTTWQLVAQMVVGLPSGPVRVVIVVVWLALSVTGLYRNASMVAPALGVLAAFVAGAAHQLPLGTGRTDEYLYPALLLLAASGVARIAAAVAGVIAQRSRSLVRAAVVFGAVVVVALAGVYADHAFTTRPVYPGVAVQTLAAEIQRNEQPGDRIFVSELMRYPWALYEEHPLDIRFGSDWSTKFTVVSTNPSVFIVPSEFYEGGSEPATWAAEMAGGHRLWYVAALPLADYQPSYAALLADGWRPLTTLTASGCSATLLVHG